MMRAQAAAAQSQNAQRTGRPRRRTVDEVCLALEAESRKLPYHWMALDIVGLCTSLGISRATFFRRASEAGGIRAARQRGEDLRLKLQLKQKSHKSASSRVMRPRSSKVSKGAGGRGSATTTRSLSQKAVRR